MASRRVRFKGMLFKEQRERLAAAGIEVVSTEPGSRIGLMKIYTVSIEANSAEEAVARVREVLMPDDVNFSNWEAAG
jgi:hypothetical protein